MLAEEACKGRNTLWYKQMNSCSSLELKQAVLKDLLKKLNYQE